MEHPPGQITCGPQIKPCKFKKTEITPSIFYEHHTLRTEINYKKKTAKTNKQTKKPQKSMWILNNMLLNNQWITEEIKEYLETNENENTRIQNLWDTEKSFLRGKFIAIQVHPRRQEKSQIDNLTLHLKQLQKEEQTKPKVSRILSRNHEN